METQPVFTIVLPPDMSQADIEDLSLELQSAGGIVQQDNRRPFDLATVIVVLTAAKLSVELAKVTLDLADKIISLRRKWREEGKKIAGELQHPQKGALDLAKASDEEIEEWVAPS